MTYSISHTNKINPTSSMELQTTQSTAFFSAPLSVPDKLHTLAVPAMQFHTKLNGFQQLA